MATDEPEEMPAWIAALETAERERLLTIPEPTAPHSEIARVLSLTVTDVPSELPTGKRTTLHGTAVNIGPLPLSLTYGGGPAVGCLWDQDGQRLAGGGEGVIASVANYKTLAPGETFPLIVDVSPFARRQRLYPRVRLPPLEPGQYRLQARWHLTVEAAGERWEGVLASPFYPVQVTATHGAS